MIARSFAYAAPRTLEEAVALVSTAGAEAVVIGGGTWVVPNLAGSRRTTLAIDLRRLSLRDIAETSSHLTIGAGVTYSMLIASDAVRRHAPLLASMASQITGGPQIRGHGTLVGSACYANVSSDVPACLLAAGATFVAISERGSREIAARDFFKGPHQTALSTAEIVTSVRVPLFPAGSSSGYHKLKICEGSWPIVTAACIAGSRNAEGARALTVGIGAASPTPLLFEAGCPANPTDAVLHAFAIEAASMITQEWSDELAGPGYRKAVASSVIETALRIALRDGSAA